MTYNSLAISGTPVASGTKDILKEHGNNIPRSLSSKDLCNHQAKMRRSYSDNHICYSVNPIRASSTQPRLKNSPCSIGIFNFQLSDSFIPTSLRSFLFDPPTSKESNAVDDDSWEANEGGEMVVETETEEEEEKRSNWVERLMEVQSRWRNKRQQKDDGESNENYEEGGCEVDYSDEEEEGETIIDRESFSSMLVGVSWSDARLFWKLALLCNIAYVIPDIKAKDLRRRYGLDFVTSSLEKKAGAEALKAKLEEGSSAAASEAKLSNAQQNVSVAYEIAASAASYVQSCTESLSSQGGSEGNDMDTHGTENQLHKSEVAAYAAASTMTSVVAAAEKDKQEAARDLQSLHSSPCEWFLCDDSSIYTRCFVIQGSDSLASWQANLFFEPTKFEGTEVLVHRGIYEAAKGIYEQFMPEIMEHLNRYGERAKLRFTGHSLGGSLSLLVNLMLLTRKVVKPSALLPVVTFGSPFVFCGGHRILEALGLDENHVHCVMTHRDIVPRAFSCKYPNHVAQVLKRLNSTFRAHPCLNKNKLLYSPMGKIFILQPDEKSSPHHPLLPQGSALYAMESNQKSTVRAALATFLNSPHPLETLSNPKAYGSEGTILRDHDSNNYLKALNGVIRQHVKVREPGRNPAWPILTNSKSPHSWSHENNLDCNNRIVSEEAITII